VRIDSVVVDCRGFKISTYWREVLHTTIRTHKTGKSDDGSNYDARTAIPTHENRPLITFNQKSSSIWSIGSVGQSKN